MIIEDLIDLFFSFLSSDSLDFSDYFEAFVTVAHYIDYFDSLIPVKLLLGCCGSILAWTAFCCVIRLVMYLI